MKPLVYIAGPYTHPDPVLNVRAAVEWGEAVEAYGCTVFIPHLSMAWHLVSPAGVDRWYDRDLEVLEHCDALFRFPGESVGADREVARAVELELPVFDTHGGNSRSALFDVDDYVTAWRAARERRDVSPGAGPKHRIRG